MRAEAVEDLKKLIGKTVREIRVSNDENDYGFDLVFDDNTVLEIYDIRCAVMSEECKKKKVSVVNIETGDSIEVIAHSIGGGVAWVVVEREDS